MILYYDRDGEPMVGVLTWAKKFEDREYQRVALDEVGEVRVSTVWLGLDHSLGDGPPLIFETMIFGGEHHEYQERYSTEALALEGHARAVSLVRS